MRSEGGRFSWKRGLRGGEDGYVGVEAGEADGMIGDGGCLAGVELGEDGAVRECSAHVNRSVGDGSQTDHDCVAAKGAEAAVPVKG